jgi:hypothetical protein
VLFRSPSEGTGFGGYKIFRALGKPDTVFQEIFVAGGGFHRILSAYLLELAFVNITNCS